MKRYALLLLSLLSLTSFGQGISTVRVKRNSTNEVLYLATTVRNITTYPLTTAGLNAFNAAASTGAFSLTVSCPDGSQSVIPAGTRPPLTAPCSATVAQNILSARYSYNSTTKVFDVEAAPVGGSALTVKIEQVGGTLPAIQSSGGQALSANTYYPPGPLAGQGSYTQEWSFRATTASGSGVPQLPIRLTWQRTSDNLTYSYVFTPTDGTRKQLFTAGGSAPANCDFTLTASGSTAGCGGAATLTASASGTAATALSYSWSGNSFTGSGASVNLTAPTSNGTYTYTVNVAKSGCATKTATANVVVNGCSGSADPDFIAYADQGWSGEDLKYLENSQIKIGIRRTVGATLCYAALKSDNINRINDYEVTYEDDPNDPRYMTRIRDKGRQLQWGSDYFTPSPRGQEVGYLINGKNTTQGYRGYVFNTGGNTVQGGSLYPALDESEIQASALVTHPTRGQMLYAKVRPNIWGVKGERGHIIIEEWLWLEGNALAYHIRHTVYERTAFGQNVPEQRAHQSREQENPCIYLTAPHQNHRIDFGSGVQNIYPGSSTTFSDTYFTTKCYIGSYDGAGKGVAYYSPMNSAVKSGQFGGSVGNAESSEAQYINASLQMNYDSPGIYEDYGYIILGTEGEVLSKISTLPGIDQSFDFDFTKDNHRWNNLDCRAKREGSDWAVYFGDTNQDGAKGGNFLAPYRAWQASGIQNIEFTMAVTGITQLKLKWQKPGRANQNEFEKVFSINGNGQMQTYTVSTSDANFNGIISSVGLQAVSGSTQSGVGKLVVRRIRKI